MKAHIVLAHPEPKSYNAHLANVAASTLVGQGWNVTLSDLHALRFDPLEQPSNYATRPDARRFDVQAEQRAASLDGTLAADVKREIAHMDAADLLIVQYPMWWHLPPAMLKGWLDRVLAFGEVYDGKKRFEGGRFAGKRALVSVTVGTPRSTYEYNGRSGDVSLMLWPVLFNFAYVGYTVLQPYVSYGVEGVLRSTEAAALEARLADNVAAYRSALADIERRPVVPFNRMSEWTKEGRIAPDAPAHSAFVRHRKNLEID